jgi:hypothetical protein
LLNRHRLQRLKAGVAVDIVARNGLPIVPAQQQHMQVVGQTQSGLTRHGGN